VLPLETRRPLPDRLRRLLAGIGLAVALAGLAEAAVALWTLGFPPDWAGVDQWLRPVFLIVSLLSWAVEAVLLVAALGLATRKTGWARPLLLVYAFGSLAITVLWLVIASANSAWRQGSSPAVQVGQVLTSAAESIPRCALALVLAGLLLRRGAAEPGTRESALDAVTPERIVRVLCVAGLLIAGSTAGKLAIAVLLSGIESLSLRGSSHSIDNLLRSASPLIEATAAALLFVGAAAWLRGHRWGRILLPLYALLWILAALSEAVGNQIFFLELDWENTSPPTPRDQAAKMRWYYFSAQVVITLLTCVHPAMTLWCLRWPEFRGRGPTTRSAFEPVFATSRELPLPATALVEPPTEGAEQ
jgi:hypothetical protein